MIIIYIILSGIIIFLSVNYLFIIYNYVKRVKVKDEFILTTNNATIITETVTESGIGNIKKSVNNNYRNNLIMTKNNNNKLNDNINININNDNDNDNNNKKLKYIKLKQAPGPIPLPILGNLTLFHKYDVPFKCFTELSKIYGNIYSLTLGSTRCVIINNLELIREVLNKNGKYFGGRPNFLRYHKLFGGDRNNSLALCDWSQLQQKRRNLARKHCSPRYTSSYYNKMDNVGCNEIKNLIKYLNDEIQLNRNYDDDDGIIIIHLKPLIMQSCANMFLKYMCSIRFDYYDKEFQEIVKKFDEIFWEINQGYAVDFLPWLYPFYKQHIEKLSSCAITVRKFILEKIINEREQQQQQQQQQQFLIHKQQKNHAEILQQEQNIDSHESFDKDDYDFTDALLKSLNDDPTLSKNTLIYMLEDFLGGHSAVGNLVMLVLANLIKNPNIYENIQNEINEIMKYKYDQNTNNQLNDDNDINNIMIDLNDMEKLPYTQATILETLRISSSPIVPHVATENVCISGYGINKGTIVFINNYELNTSEKYWEKPEYFMPERFLEKQIQNNCNSDQKQWLSVSLSSSSSSSSSSSLAFSLTKNSSTEKILYRVKQNIPHFFPFSVGKRTCIGQNLVKCFSFILLANILKNFNIHYVDKEPIKMYPACVALPPNTFRLKLERRNVM